MIPYGKQDISEADIEAVVRVLRSDYLTQGPAVPEFEKVVSKHVGANYGVAVNSATSALHIACLALGLGKGDYLWTSPITFVASANCGLYCGASVDFVDIDPRTYNLCPDALERKLLQAEKTGALPKIVVPVHLCGQPCDMERIHNLSKKFGFRIIEDASHAIGGKYRDNYIGSCKYSDVTIFSFHPVKIVTTAEGGLAVTNDESLAETMRLSLSHGITRDQKLMHRESDGPWYYEQVALGFNYRMTEMQAALGVSQMHRLDQFVAKRHDLAERYNQLLASLPITLPWQSPDCYSGLHLYVIRLQLDEISATHLQVFESLRAKGVMVNLHYIPVYRQPYYQVMGFKQEQFPRAEQYYREAISIPMHPNLTEDEQQYVVDSIVEAIGR